jgi:hypothetical protein
MNLKRGFGSDRQKFASMVTALDRSVQTVVNVLKAKNMWENTVFLFHSDNGGAVVHPGPMNNANPIQTGGLNPATSDFAGQAHIVGSSNYPLRGAKFESYEGGIRVPGFIAGGGVRLSKGSIGKETFALMHFVDIHSTLLGFAGPRIDGNDDGGNPLDSIDMIEKIHNPILDKYDLKGKYELRNEILHHIETSFFGLIQMAHTNPRKPPAKYFPETNPERVIFPAYKGRRTIRVGSMKLICPFLGRVAPRYPLDPGHYDGWFVQLKIDNNRECQLFNIDNDPEEKHDLGDVDQPTFNKLFQRIEYYRTTQLMDPMKTASMSVKQKNHGRGIMETGDGTFALTTYDEADEFYNRK